MIQPPLPSFGKSISTKIGKLLFRMVCKHFPRNHKLRKIFDLDSLDLSHSSMTNMKNIIQEHNLKALTNNKEKDGKKVSDFRNKGNCTLKSDSHLPKKLVFICFNEYL